MPWSYPGPRAPNRDPDVSLIPAERALQLLARRLLGRFEPLVLAAPAHDLRGTVRRLDVPPGRFGARACVRTHSLFLFERQLTAGLLGLGPQIIGWAAALVGACLSHHDSCTRPVEIEPAGVARRRSGYGCCKSTIVPIATVGGADAMPVVTSGRRLAKALSLDKVARLKVFPIAVQAPWGLSPAVLPEIPFPTKIRTAFQEPIELDGDPERAQDDRYVERMHDQAQTSIQHGMDALARRRKFSLFG